MYMEVVWYESSVLYGVHVCPSPSHRSRNYIDITIFTTGLQVKIYHNNCPLTTKIILSLGLSVLCEDCSVPRISIENCIDIFCCPSSMCIVYIFSH